MNADIALMLAVTNTLMMFVGFMIGDEHHHEASDIAIESGFDQHVQQALWVARRTVTS